eukprot:symbB.v1.2.005997.t1/scaffold276.1/size251734/19
MAAKEAAARQAVESFIQKQNVEGIVQELIQKLLVAKPENPRQFLLNYLEKDLQAQDDELTETDLQKLFLVSRCITGKINPQETIRATIKETMGLLNCDAVSLYVLDRKMQMLRLYTHHAEFPIMLRLDHGIAGSVFLKQELVNIANCQQDSRFDRTMDMQTGYFTRSMLVVPILDIEGQGCGVIQAINKIPSGVEIDDTVHIGKSAVAFSVTDEKMLLHLVQNVAIAIQNAEIYREAINNSERATGLLNTIQSVSQDLGPQSLLLTVTTHASKVCSAERSTVFLVDEAMQQLWSVSTDTGAEIRIPKDKGIAGECCCHCTVINIPDAYADPRFNKQTSAALVYTSRDFSISTFSSMRRGRPIALALFAFVVTLRTGRWLSFAAPPAAKPKPAELLQALGRELWVVGDGLLVLSSKVRSTGAVSLSNAGISLRNAADMMCDGSWEDVQGELEGAASSCESYLPANNWQGLINLFGYYEAVPECEWSSARSSLTGLAGALERVEEELMSSIRFADQDYIQETKLYYDMVLGKLRRAGDLFLPGRLCCVDSGRYGSFYLPPDPRSEDIRRADAAPGKLEERFFGGSRQRYEEWKAATQDQSLNPYGCRDRAWQDARAMGQDAVDLLLEVEKELEQEKDLRKRGRVLRKLLVKLHPDQNRGQEKVTAPVFEYVQALRASDIDA